jgi:hypothetical protein
VRILDFDEWNESHEHEKNFQSELGFHSILCN